MSKQNNLKDYLTDLYEGISSKNPNASRNPQDFRAEMESLFGALDEAELEEIYKLIGSGAGESHPMLYDGEYTVIPSDKEQVLETGAKLMASDVTVEKIPYAEVTNNAGGHTATIG